MCSYACADNVPDVVPAQPCTSTAGLLQRMDGLTATCCPDGSCDATLPTACDFSCELAVLAFVADCQTFFGIEQLEPIMQPVMELCEAVAPETDQTEISVAMRSTISPSEGSWAARISRITDRQLNRQRVTMGTQGGQ